MSLRKIFLVLALICISSLVSHGQETANKCGFEASIYSSNALTDNYHADISYRDIGIAANYNWHFYQDFYLSPQIGLGFNLKPVDKDLTGGPVQTKTLWHGRIGVTVCRNLGPVEIFTGPYMRYVFNDDSRWINNAGMLWSFGLGVPFWRMYGRVSFDLKVTNQYSDSDTANALSLGIGYRF